MKLIPENIAFPMMHKEQNEKRDFTPEIFRSLKELNCDFYLETGYGSNMDFCHEDYTNANPKIKFISQHECFKKDIVVVLRAPEENEIKQMKQYSILFSMLHFSTRKKRNSLMEKQKINTISMDSVKDDSDSRMIVNFEATAWNGVILSFETLIKTMSNLKSAIINVFIIGMGSIGREAAGICCYIGKKKLLYPNVDGVIVKAVVSDITDNTEVMRGLMQDCDILIDATSRKKASKHIIPNSWLKNLPEHAVILDLTADPYDININPPQVKGIEGIPTGTLDKMVFFRDDKDYDKNIPDSINTNNRRTTVSCNAWPGVKPVKSMEVYGNQIVPFIKLLFQKSYSELSIKSDSPLERALFRGTYKYFLQNNQSDF